MGEHSLAVELPGEEIVLFHFAVTPRAQTTEILIDASPAPYCDCCGWDFEPR